MTHMIFSQCLTLSVCCLNLNLQCLTHDQMRQLSPQCLVYPPIIFSIYMPEFLRPLLIILWVRVYCCQRHFVCLFGEHNYLQEYVGYGICDFLEFGWPVGFDCSRPLPIHTNFHNHKGATLLLMLICRASMHTMRLLVRFLIISFHVLW